MIQIVHNNFLQYIKDELCRIMSYSDDMIVEEIIHDVVVCLPKVWDDCSVSTVVFDCIRKKVISLCKEDAKILIKTRTEILKEAKFPEDNYILDDLRLEVVLFFLSKKQRKYFLERYYYLRDDVKENKKFERTISKFFNGKGIASFRFRYFKIPRKKVTTDLYVDYLDRLNYTCLSQLNVDKSTIICPNILDVSYPIIIAERNYSITKYSIPICFVILFLFTLFYFFILY